MSDIWSTFPWDLIPDSLKAEETRAFSTAMGNAFHRMLPYTGRVSGHASIDMLPDEILDLLAVELKTQYYREDLPQDTKRELIRQTIPWYMQAGTPSVIREYLGTVFDGGKTEEWFSYGGKPYYFRAYVYAESHEIPLGYGEEVKQQIQDLIPVHHAEVGFQGRGLGVLHPFIQHIDQTIDIIFSHHAHSLSFLGPVPDQGQDRLWQILLQRLVVMDHLPCHRGA